MKKVNNKKIIALFIILACTMLFTVCYRAQQITNNKDNSTIQPNLVDRFNFSDFVDCTSPKEYLTIVDKKDKSIWHAIESALGITQEQFIAMKNEDAWQEKYNAVMNDMASHYAQAKEISKENYQLATEILSLCGLDNKNIKIIAWDGPAPAASTDTLLLINQELFEPLSLEIKKFIIAHESSHIINKDHSTSCMLEDFNELQKDNSKTLSKVMNECSHFCEVRADIFATSHGIEFAQGHVLFAEHELKLLGNIVHPHYPSNGERLEIGQKLLAMIKQNNKV